MKALTPFLLALTLLSLASLPAEAGKRVTAPVSITIYSPGTGMVSGSIGSTRKGTGTTQYIGSWAQIGRSDDVDFLSGGMVARDAAGTATVNCMFPFGAMYSYLPQLALINSDSYVQFGFEPPSSANPPDPNSVDQTKCKQFYGIPQCCNSLGVYSFSYDQPK
jgi:hypothetical protein